MANEDKAARYHRLRRRAELTGSVAAAAALVLLLASGASLRLREVGSLLGDALAPPAAVDAATAAIMAVLILVLLQIVELPFHFYQGYLLEHRYGLSRQSFGRWLADLAKGATLGTVFGALGAGVVYATLTWSPAWWWLASAAVFAVALVGLAQLTPVLLLPLFYAFKPLDRPALAARLVALAARAGTQVVGVFEWVLSGHTTKANAALTGLGRTRRILLSDTLLADYSDEEIEVILAHELSHHVHHDLWRGMALQAALLVGGFFVAHLVLQGLARPLGLAGLADPAGLPLLLLTAGAWSFLLMPVGNALSRAHERRADRYALDATDNAAAFVSAMRRLGQQNMAEERPSPLVRWLYYSHPPIRERIASAEAWRRASGGARHPGVTAS